MPAELTSAGRSRQTSAGCQPSRLTPGEEGVPWQCRDALAARQNAVTLWGRSCEGRAPVRNTPGVKIEDKAVDTTFQDATTTTTSKPPPPPVWPAEVFALTPSLPHLSTAGNLDPSGARGGVRLGSGGGAAGAEAATRGGAAPVTTASQHSAPHRTRNPVKFPRKRGAEWRCTNCNDAVAPADTRQTIIVIPTNQPTNQPWTNLNIGRLGVATLVRLLLFSTM